MDTPTDPVALAAILSELAPTRARREELYRHFHRHPELSMREYATARRIEAELNDAGITPRRVGATGVVSVLENGPGPVVAVRADIDGLPMAEESGKEYSSQATQTDAAGRTVPVAHTCGHDLHLVSLLSALQFFHSRRDQWQGTFVGVFQPGEETAAGARDLLARGLADLIPRPDVYLGQHVLSSVPGGAVATRPGPVLSAGGSIQVTVHGEGGHGAMPERTVDPVVLAAAIVLRLQTVVSREVAADQTAVLTVGALRAGSKSNIIPDRAELLINLRAYDEGVKRVMAEAVERIVRAECAASRSPREPEFEYYDDFPLTDNDAGVTARVRAAFERYFGDHATELAPVPASEDFSVIPDALRVPYCFWGLGGFADQDSAPGNHHPAFAPDLQPTLDRGVEAIVVAAGAWLVHPAAR